MRSEEWVEEFFEFFAILILAEELVEVQSPAADDTASQLCYSALRYWITINIIILCCYIRHRIFPTNLRYCWTFPEAKHLIYAELVLLR